MVLGLLDGFDDVLVAPFMPDSAVVALDIGVLLGLSGLDVLDGDALFLGPDQQLFDDLTAEIKRQLSVKDLCVNANAQDDRVDDFTLPDSSPDVGL